MFRHLPRHMFGYVQSKLFPKYFLLGTVLSSVALATYVLEHPFGKWETKQIVQVSLFKGEAFEVDCNNSKVQSKVQYDVI